MRSPSPPRPNTSLAHPAAVAGAEPRLQTLWRWLWHAAEESEHRSTAFDATCATTALWRWHPWRSGWTFLPGREGLLRRIYRPWRDYFAAGCHPRRQDGGPGERWLSENTGAYTAVPR